MIRFFSSVAGRDSRPATPSHNSVNHRISKSNQPAAQDQKTVADPVPFDFHKGYCNSSLHSRIIPQEPAQRLQLAVQLVDADGTGSQICGKSILDLSACLVRLASILQNLRFFFLYCSGVMP